MKTFLFDFAVFPGNSGGPVYFSISNPTYGNMVHLGGTIARILGVVVGEKGFTQKIVRPYEKSETTTPLALAEVIHASFIRELIDTLGLPEQAPQ